MRRGSWDRKNSIHFFFFLILTNTISGSLWLHFVFDYVPYVRMVRCGQPVVRVFMWLCKLHTIDEVFMRLCKLHTIDDNVLWHATGLSISNPYKAKESQHLHVVYSTVLKSF